MDSKTKKVEKTKKWSYLVFNLSLKAYYGIFSFLMVFLGMALFVIFVLSFEKIPGRLDMTKEKIYTLSSDSKKILDKLDNLLKIEFVWQKDLENQHGLQDLYRQTNGFLKQYSAYSKYVDYQVIDPLIYPDIVASYIQRENEKIEHGTLIISSGDFVKILPFESWAGYQGSKKIKINTESPVSNAIVYVMEGKVSKVYSVVGHGEAEVFKMIQNTGRVFAETLVENNIEILPLNIEVSQIPEDADALLILSPLGDYSMQEIDLLKEFVKKKGRLWVNLSYTRRVLSRLESFLGEYGIFVMRGVVVETSEDRLVPSMANSPMYFFVENHGFPGKEMTTRKDGVLVIGQALGLKTNESKNLDNSVEVSVLISSSDRAVLLGSNENGSDSQKLMIGGRLTQVSKSQKFDLAYTVREKFNGQESVDIDSLRLIVTTGDLFLMSRFSQTAQFYLDIVSWLDQTKDNIRIPSKNFSDSPLYLTSRIVALLSLLFVVGIPGCFIFIGFTIRSKRRYT